jgi:hypothetical protein
MGFKRILLVAILFLAVSNICYSISSLDSETEISIRTPNQDDVNVFDWYVANEFLINVSEDRYGINKFSCSLMGAVERENGIEYSEHKARLTYLLPFYLIKSEFRTHYKEAQKIDDQIFTLGWSASYINSARREIIFGAGLGVKATSYRSPNVAFDLRIPMPGEDGRCNLTLIYGEAPIWDINVETLPVKRGKVKHKVVFRYYTSGDKQTYSLSYKIGVRLL